MIEDCHEVDDRFAVGNIFRGRVKKIMPGLKSASLDLGSRDGFLYLEGDTVPQVGESLPVQITHAATGKKSARISTRLVVPLRTVLLLPQSSGTVNVSRKIAENEAARLKQIGQELCPTGFGLVIRTAALNEDKARIAADIAEGQAVYKNILAKFAAAKRPTLLYDGGSLLNRILRDTFTEAIDELVTDDEALFAEAKTTLNAALPHLAARLHFYESDEPLFERYNLSAVLRQRDERTFSLPSGGFIVIDPTEALTAIDVNSGSFSASTPEETIRRTNMEAAAELMRQLRLKNVGGIIVVDFIDMKSPKDREELLDELRRLSVADNGRTTVVDITPLGLVELTRRRGVAL